MYLGGNDKVLPELKDNTISFEVNDDGATVIKISGKLTDDNSGMDGGRIGNVCSRTFQHNRCQSSDIGKESSNILPGSYDPKLVQTARSNWARF